MGKGSDLDAYIVQLDDRPTDSDSQQVQEAVKVANLFAGLPPLDGEGSYLLPVKANDIVDSMGKPEDDGGGMLTKRMLLLLESRVLLGEPAHRRLVDRVIDGYWLNEDLHQKGYLPLVLVNDIVRYWRIVLLNHESRLRKRRAEVEEDPTIATKDQADVLLAERRYRSYKLHFPRCLTCFSALTYLLALTPLEEAHVTKEQVREMIDLSPLERLRRLPHLVGRKLELVDQLLSAYRSYLQRTDIAKDELLKQLRFDDKVRSEVPKEGDEFTKLMFELVQYLGGGRRLHRHMLV